MGMANQLELISVYACCSTRATKGSTEGGDAYNTPSRDHCCVCRIKDAYISIVCIFSVLFRRPAFDQLFFNRLQQVEI